MNENEFAFFDNEHAINYFIRQNGILNYKINKAIEYIENRYDGEVLTSTFDKDNVKELLDILKGSDKE